jgi:hypothetical protein
MMPLTDPSGRRAVALRPLSGCRARGRRRCPRCDDDVRKLAGELHLRERLLADHGLVQEHVVTRRTTTVRACLLAAGGRQVTEPARTPDAGNRSRA